MTRPEQGTDDPIRHVVLLILENHSFDQMLGCFKAVYPALDGVDPASPGRNTDASDRAYAQTPTTIRQMLLDPHHEVEAVAAQLADHNGGFVSNFASIYPDSTPEARQLIMDYFPRGFLPGLHTLAAEFTICDRWHASLPGPTWPNRFFALSGTSMGRVNMPNDGTHKADLPGYFEQTQDTIFDRLNERGIHWKVYFHDIPQTTVFAHQREPHNAARYFYVDEFYKDARGHEEEFPQFCLVEPCYIGWSQNDDHPPHDIMRAEKLIADVYNAIRSNDPLWKSTLLVVFYDEHGGFYDHVEPPTAVAPDDHREEYTFDRLGVRVPALLVSPYVERGVNATLFDHTSVLKYLIDKWALGPLGRRTGQAASIGVCLTRTAPRDDTTLRIELSQEQLNPPDPEQEGRAFSELNTHQTALQLLAAHLKGELVVDAPRAYSWLARRYEELRVGLGKRLRNWLGLPGKVQASLAHPDRLAHHQDAAPKNAVAQFLMSRKRQAVPRLAATLRSEILPEDQRRHALRTLAVITGRNYHREANGMQNAMGWLGRHGH